MSIVKKLFITWVSTSILFAGCGGNMFEGLSDSNSAMSKKEEAKIALDKGDYTEAVSLLEELCGTDTSNLTCDEETQTDLASAYIAIATGLDVLQLIDAADTAAATESFSTISTLLPIEEINACAADPSSCTIQTNMDSARYWTISFRIPSLQNPHRRRKINTSSSPPHQQSTSW